MKKGLLFIFTIFLAFATGKTYGQANTPIPGFVQIIQCPAPGFTTYGSTNVYESPFITYGCFDPTTPACFYSGPPARATLLGSGSSAGYMNYKFTGRKVYQVGVQVTGLNAGEYLQVSYGINGIPGVPPPTGLYAIQPSDVHSYTSCYSFGGPAGPCTITGGTFNGPACCALGASSPSNGGEFWVSDCHGITDFNIYTNATAQGADVVVFFDTTNSIGCSDATSNDPCEGDTLKLGDVGDSTGATYFWTGPFGFTSTAQYPVVFPAPLAYTGGTFKAYKTQGFIHDTDTVVVTIHPRAYIKKISNNSPICENLLDTLQLRITTPGAPGETYMWTGPNSFTSTDQNPDIYGFAAIDTGTYYVKATTPFGCADSNSTYVVLQPPPPPPIIVGPTPYCYGATFVPFTTVTSGGATVLWYPSGTGGVGSTTAPTINTSTPGTYTVYATQKDGLYCESVRDSFVVVVKPQIKPEFNWNTLLGCDQDVVTFHNISTGADWYSWAYGDGQTSGDTTTKITTQNIYKHHQVWRAVLYAYIPDCRDSAIGFVNTTHSVKASFWPMGDTICAGGFTTKNDSSSTMDDSSIVITPDGAIGNLFGGSFTITGPIVADTAKFMTDPKAPAYLAANYSWDFGDGQVDVTNTRTPPAHRYDTGGFYTVKLKVTDSIGCVDTISHTVNVIQMRLHSVHDTLLCVSQDMPIFVDNDPKVKLGDLDNDYKYQWTPSTYLSSDTVQSPFYTYRGNATTTYTLTATEFTYGCYTIDTIKIRSVIGVKLQNVTADATILYGRSIQLNADSEVYYVWKNNDGSLDNANINNPVATPLTTTLYKVYGYDRNNCLDSAFINVKVDSSMIENVPSGFTPNGDGLNDVFRPVGLKFQNLVDFRVYNRLGQQVFYSNSIKNGWDGTYYGTPQDIGTYFYVIVVAKPGGEGEDITYKGTVTLIR